jgi:hypothetical protein
MNTIRSLLVVAALSWGCFPALAHDRSVGKDEGDRLSMQFEWHTEAPADRCGNGCRAWISAVGVISSHTAGDFAAFAAANDVRGATLVLDSPGGSVLAALALGALIRKFEMTTTVGRTIAPRTTSGQGATLSPAGSCQSMCVFVLLGGKRRYVPPEAEVLVHQIWLAHESARPLDASYTAQDLSLVQRDIGRIARYTVEMGGNIELLETALRVPPWNPLYALTVDEIHHTKLTTVDHLFEQDMPVMTSHIQSLGH